MSRIILVTCTSGLLACGASVLTVDDDKMSAGGAGGGRTAGGSAAGGSAAGGSAAGGSTAGGSTAGGDSTADGSKAGGSTAGGSTAGGSTAGGTGGGAQGLGITFSSVRDGPGRIDFSTAERIFGRITGLSSTPSLSLGCTQPVGSTSCTMPSSFTSILNGGWAYDASSQAWRIEYAPGSFPAGWYEAFVRDGSTQVTSPVARLVVGAPSGTSGVCQTVPRAPGWVRSLRQISTSDVMWIEIPGTYWNPFPLSGGSGRIATTHGEYLALRFTVPTDPVACAAGAAKLLTWIPSQVDGEAEMSRTYVTISQCPGDFRFPTEASAPAADPTYARGCRSFRRRPGLPVGPMSNIGYRIGTGPSDEFVCELACGQTYFINFVRATPSFTGLRTPAEEIDPGFSSNCNTVHPQTTFCGVQMRYQ